MGFVPLPLRTPLLDTAYMRKGGRQLFWTAARGWLITAYLHHITLDTAATTRRVARLSSVFKRLSSMGSYYTAKYSQICVQLAALEAPE